MDARTLAGLPLRVAADAAYRATLTVTDAVLGARVTGEVVDRIVASALVERAVERLLETDALEQIMVSAQQAAVARRVIDSELLDEFVERLLQSEELWILVDEIARSPSVTEAIGSQSIGFADQIAGVVRERTRTADDRVERVARRMLRRKSAGPAPNVQPG